jgi:hypothetical protein
MKKKLINVSKLILCAALIFGAYSCQTEDIAPESDMTNALERGPKANSTIEGCDQIYTSTNLYAGQNILVGEVTVTGSDGNYEVTYNLTNDGYCLVETHLSVVTNASDFPMTRSGNPIPGNFEYSNSHSCVSSFTYPVTLEDFQEGDKVYIAAHAVVNCVSDVTSETFETSLPNELLNVCVTGQGESGSYFDVLIADGNILSGAKDAWCLDLDGRLSKGQCFDADVYSSYNDPILPAGAFEQTGNFKGLNWLLNQNFVGTEATPELGNYTFGDIQVAIWTLIEDTVCSNCESFDSGPYSSERVDMLIAMAIENNDFVPGCGEDVLIIIVPRDGKQIIGITIPAPCGDCDETAWADGCDFPGNNWATFFQYGSSAN